MSTKDRWNKEFKLSYDTIKTYLGKEYTKIEICCNSEKSNLNVIKNRVSERTFKRMFNGGCKEDSYIILKQRLNEIIKHLKLEPIVYEKILSLDEYRDFEKVEVFYLQLVKEFATFADTARNDKSFKKFLKPIALRYKELFTLIEKFEIVIELFKEQTSLLSYCKALSQASKCLIVDGLRLEYLAFIDYEDLKMREPEMPIDKGTFLSIKRELVSLKAQRTIKIKIAKEKDTEIEVKGELKGFVPQPVSIERQNEEILNKLFSDYSIELRQSQDWFDSTESLLTNIFKQKKKEIFQVGN